MVVSDASELLFEDIKKLNAQQRPDVPTCLIYAPISLLPMSTKHQRISTFLNSTQHALQDRALLFSASAVSGIWNCETIGERSRFGCNRLQLKFNEMEADTEFFSLRSNTLLKVCLLHL